MSQAPPCALGSGGFNDSQSGRPGPVTAAWGVCSRGKGLALRKFLGEGGRSQSQVLFVLSPEEKLGDAQEQPADVD